MAKTNKVTEPEIPAEEKKYTIKLPRLNSKQEDKVVWINNDRYLIKRGVPVEVPESVYLVLQEEERNERIAYEFEQGNAHE